MGDFDKLRQQRETAGKSQINLAKPAMLQRASALPDFSEARPPGIVPRRSWSVPEWARLHGIGNTLAWELVRTGKVKARKIGHRTIITNEADREFIDSLPLAKGGAA